MICCINAQTQTHKHKDVSSHYHIMSNTSLYVFVYVQADAEWGVKLTQPGVWEPAPKKVGNFVTIRGDGGCSKTVGSHSRQQLPIESQCPGLKGANRAPQEACRTL